MDPERITKNASGCNRGVLVVSGKFFPVIDCKRDKKGYELYGHKSGGDTAGLFYIKRCNVCPDLLHIYDHQVLLLLTKHNTINLCFCQYFL